MTTGNKAWNAFQRYHDRFGKYPDVTIIRMNDENSQPFIDAVDNAIKTDKRITNKEWGKIEYEVFGDFYDPAQGRLT